MLRTCGVRLQRALIRPATINRPQSTAPSQNQHTHPAATSQQLPTATADGNGNTNTGPGGTEIRTHFERLRKPTRAPLLRNFFAGTVDTELLTYPEPITREDMQPLDRSVQQLGEYFAQHAEAIGSIGGGAIPAALLADLRAQGAFGLDVPAAWGGRNCTVTELTRHAEVEAGADVNIATVLNAHRLAVRCIVECGSDEQRERYLPRLASGDLTAAVALHEADASTDGTGTAEGTAPRAIFQTRASCDGVDLRSSWQLRGDKPCVTSAPDADLFVVFAQTSGADRCGDPLDGVSAFLVERSAVGVQVLPADRTLGTRAAPQATVRLDGVAGEPLGELGAGDAVAQQLLRCARLQTAVVALALQKRMLALWTRYVVERTRGKQEMELVRGRLSRAHCAAFALESMVYLTTGVMDGYEGADVDVESAALRVFAVDTLRATATAGVEFAGAQAVLEDGGFGERELRDALQVCAVGESSDALRLFVGMSGVKQAGESLHDVVRKVRNPLYNPSFIFRRMFDGQNIDEPKCSLQLNHHLHPSLDPAAQWLEQSVLRLQAATEVSLTRHGVQILEQQSELRRLADCAVQCFASFAAVARASRSYCIGLQYADYEMLAASTFAFDAQLEVKRLAVEVRDGPYLTNDVNHQKLATQLLRSGGYFAVHPLQRNF